MDEQGMYLQHPCKGCGRPLNEGGGRPAELYAGTYTGLCYRCASAEGYVVKAYDDGAKRISYPPHAPGWRRDREEEIAYGDCPECKGTGRHYVSRAHSKGGSYYRYCEPCHNRFYNHPGRKWVDGMHTTAYRAADSVWKQAMSAMPFAKKKLVDLDDEERDLVESVRRDTRARLHAVVGQLSVLAARRGYY